MSDSIQIEDEIAKLRPHIVEPKSRPPREPILTERERTHGSFTQTAHIAQGLKHAIRSTGVATLTAQQLEALDMIATKIARILSGNPNERDHWKDIAGYAKLGEEACD